MKIKVLLNEARGSTNVVEFESDYCLIGRKNANLILSDPRCSQQHTIFYQGPDSKLWMKDLESTNGTQINGKRTSECVLYIGDEIKIGKSKLVILDFRPSVEKATVTVAHNSHSVEEVDEKTGELVTQWPQAMFAAPKTVQTKFVDYVDDEGTKTRIKIKDLLKAA